MKLGRLVPILSLSMSIWSCASRTFSQSNTETMAGAPLHKREQEGNAFCFFPGAAGGGVVINQMLPNRLKARGIRFIPLKTGRKGTVQQRVKHVEEQVQQMVNQEPNLRCHFVGHSLGGITSRYALNHVEINHPTLGRVPLKAIGASLTLLQAAVEGNPIADIVRFLDFNKKTVSATAQSGYHLIRIFSDPKFPKTYSPMPQEFPVYSYRTYITSQRQMLARPEAALLGYLVIKKLEQKAGRDPRNDGTIPLLSQTAGLVIADMHAPHGYFSAKKTWVKVDVADFFEWHWRFLTSSDPTRLEVMRQKLWASGLSSKNDLTTPESEESTLASTANPPQAIGEGNKGNIKETTPDDDTDEIEPFNPILTTDDPVHEASSKSAGP